MTDQLQLFSEPLTSIKRRTIKVEGGKLYSDQRETAIMKIKNVESQLTDVLYVPDLGVNLLSARRFTKGGLKGSFDNDGLYVHTSQETELLKAPAQGGIYIVNKVASELDDFALTVVAISSSEQTTVALSAIADAKNSSSLDSIMSSQSEDNAAAPKKRDLYTLWHRRLGI